MARDDGRATEQGSGRLDGADVPDDGATAGGPPTLLTHRQREVAALVARGCSNKQIAEQLTLTDGTVANHIEAIRDRLNLKTRSHITAWAVDHGLTQTQDRLLTLLERLLEMQEPTLKAALERAATLIAEVLSTDKIDLFLHEPATDTLVAVGASDTPMAKRQRAIGMDRLPIANGGRTVEVFQTGASYWTGRADCDAGELVGITQGLGVRSTIAVALEVAGERRGVVAATSAAAEAYTERDLRFLEAVGRWVGGVVHRAELTEQIAAAAAEQGRRAAAEELITVLAHDLRNHLTPMKGRIQLIQQRATREHHQAYLADANEAATSLARLTRLVTDLLDIGRLEQGLFAMSPQPVNLATLVQETAAALRGGTVDIRIQTPEEVVCGVDPDRIRQALENLLANAVRHSPAGGTVTLQLTTLTRGGDHAAVMAVADEGPGIPPELLPWLFERFAAGPGSTGLGLGLYLAKRIADAHGGTLTIDSAPGHGARFALSVPCEGLPLETRGQPALPAAP